MRQVGVSAAAFNDLGVILLIYMKQPSAAVKAVEQSLRYDPDYEKARVNLATARSLMPAPTVVHLPPRPRVKAPDQPQGQVATADVLQAEFLVAERLVHGQSAAVALPAGL